MPLWNPIEIFFLCFCVCVHVEEYVKVRQAMDVILEHVLKFQYVCVCANSDGDQSSAVGEPFF